MSRTVYAVNEYHLGDCIHSLHLIRAFAKKQVSVPFVFFCHGCYIDQLREVVQDLPNILLESFESELWPEKRSGATNMWKNHEGFWEKSPVRWTWSDFMLTHHRWTASRMGLISPFDRREDLLLDYPALQSNPMDTQRWDFLIGNSEPCSGQFTPMAQHGSGYLEPLISALRSKGHTVICTEDLKRSGHSISSVGEIALRCKRHIMVASGPFWTTLNTTLNHSNYTSIRIALLDNGEAIHMPQIHEYARIEQVMRLAEQEKWI
jgi:hypothetical protein